MRQYHIISADSHVVEPGDLWIERLDRRLRDRAPRIVRMQERDLFVCDGLAPSGVALLGAADRPPEELPHLRRYEDNRSGGWDMKARLEDLGRDGIDGEVLFPTLALRLFRLSDAQLRSACFAAYNEWLAELCRGAPDRLRGIGLVSTPELQAIGETLRALERVRALGHAGALIAIRPSGVASWADPSFAPLFSAAEALGLPLCMHILADGPGTPIDDFLTGFGSIAAPVQHSISALILGGVLSRHPRLELVVAECDIGWIGTFLQRLDHLARRHGPRLGVRLEEPPSAYFRRAVRCTFMEDPAGLRQWDLIGTDNLLWASDYPHADTTFPHSRQVLREQLASLPVGVQRKLRCGNAMRLFQFDGTVA